MSDYEIQQRPRRLRMNATLRRMLEQVRLSCDDFVYPLFVKEGIKEDVAVVSMPGVFQRTLKSCVAEAKDAYKAGVPAIMLFGIPDKKDSKASGAYANDGIVQKAVSEIKAACPDLLVMTDVCLCEYMDHGHCGLVSKSGEILNDASLELLAQTALSHAQAGSDLVAPSDMMDFRVGAIRQMLDENGFTHIPIMSYAVKYASAFYGPFRDVAESAPKMGDRKSYQMNFSMTKEAIKEALLDESEGADIIMVKPAMAYLDIMRELRDVCSVPLAAYHVSGEYSMIKAASAQGWVDEMAVVKESFTAIKRAGAKIIITYFAKDFIQSL